MKQTCLLIAFLLAGNVLRSQHDLNTVFTKGDQIDLVATTTNDFFYVHSIQKGQSLYALSRIFKVSLSQIYRINNLESGATIAIGQQIKIPIYDQNLFKGISLGGLKYGKYVPVYYTTRPKENLYRIARVFFDQPIEDLIQRNDLSSKTLSLGQKLLIGWFPIDSPVRRAEEEFEEEFDEVLNSEDDEATSGEVVHQNEETPLEPTTVRLDSDTSVVVEAIPSAFDTSLLGINTYRETIAVKSKSEVANWDKTMPDNGTVYVLHKDALLYSYIEMYNPLLKRSVRAKVIGRIPYGAYASNVNLVLSPRAAKQLGALDSRFKVKVKYLLES